MYLTYEGLVCVFEVCRLLVCYRKKTPFPPSPQFLNSFNSFCINTVYWACVFWFLFSYFFLFQRCSRSCDSYRQFLFISKCVVRCRWHMMAGFSVGLFQANGFCTSEVHPYGGNQQLNNAFVSVTFQWNVDQATQFSCLICC